LSERSEFLLFPAFTFTAAGIQRRRGRLLLLTFLGEARKVSGRRASPGMYLTIRHKQNRAVLAKGAVFYFLLQCSAIHI